MIKWPLGIRPDEYLYRVDDLGDVICQSCGMDAPLADLEGEGICELCGCTGYYLEEEDESTPLTAILFIQGINFLIHKLKEGGLLGKDN